MADTEEFLRAIADIDQRCAAIMDIMLERYPPGREGYEQLGEFFNKTIDLAPPEACIANDFIILAVLGLCVLSSRRIEIAMEKLSNGDTT